MKFTTVSEIFATHACILRSQRYELHMKTILPPKAIELLHCLKNNN